MRRLLGAAAATAIAFGAVGCSSGSSGGSTDRAKSGGLTSDSSPDSAIIGRPVQQTEISIEGQIFQPVATTGWMWVIGTDYAQPSGSNNVVWRLDPETHTVTDTIPVGRSGSLLAAGAGSLWAVSRDDESTVLVRIDSRTRKITGKQEIADDPDAIVAGEGGVWLADSPDSGTTIRKIDPETLRVTETLSIPGLRGRFDGLALAPGVLWALGRGADDRPVLVRVDPATATEVTRITIPAHTVQFMTATLGGAWLEVEDPIKTNGQYSGSSKSRIIRVDQATNRAGAPRSLPIPPSEGLMFGDGAIWTIGNVGSDLGVVRLDPGTGRVTDTYRVIGGETTAPAGHLTLDGGQMWLRAFGTGGLDRLVAIGPLVAR